MQCRKHNFSHNFLSAVGSNKLAAWDILVNEINEVILEFPKETTKAIRDSGLRIHDNPSPKDMVEVIHEGIYVNGELRTKLLKLISKRQANPHYSADGGEYDITPVEGVASDLNFDGDILNESEEVLNIMGSGFKKLVGNVKDKVGGAVDKQKSKDMQAANMTAKQKQRNLPVSKTTKPINAVKVIGIALAVAAAVGIAALIIYKANQRKTA